jgi:hypothetical protein
VGGGQQGAGWNIAMATLGVHILDNVVVMARGCPRACPCVGRGSDHHKGTAALQRRQSDARRGRRISSIRSRGCMVCGGVGLHGESGRPDRAWGSTVGGVCTALPFSTLEQGAGKYPVLGRWARLVRGRCAVPVPPKPGAAVTILGRAESGARPRIAVCGELFQANQRGGLPRGVCHLSIAAGARLLLVTRTSEVVCCEQQRRHRLSARPQCPGVATRGGKAGGQACNHCP